MRKYRNYQRFVSGLNGSGSCPWPDVIFGMWTACGIKALDGLCVNWISTGLYFLHFYIVQTTYNYYALYWIAIQVPVLSNSFLWTSFVYGVNFNNIKHISQFLFSCCLWSFQGICIIVQKSNNFTNKYKNVKAFWICLSYPFQNLKIIEKQELAHYFVKEDFGIPDVTLAIFTTRECVSYLANSAILLFSIFSLIRFPCFEC